MSATSAFRVVRMDCPAIDRGQCVFEKSGFVQCIGMNSDLNIMFTGGSQAGIDSARSGTPILVQLQTDYTRFNLFD
ncbi:hypothetical protein D3C74_477070 [compost metagenome]